MSDAHAKSDWRYGGITAESYDLWFGDEPYVDQRFYQQHIVAAGGPALEIACGTGRLLLPYLRDGLDVDGVDSSAEMLAICRQKAHRLGLSPTLHQQLMQDLDLPRRYATIFVPFASFQILARREEAFEALRRFHAHLMPGGQLLVSLFVPWEDFARDGLWRLRRAGTRPSDGATVLIHECVRSDRLEQLQTMVMRYEICKEGQLVHSEHRTHTLRWYHQHEFTMMLEQTGFRDAFVYGDYTKAPAEDRHTMLIFRARTG